LASAVYLPALLLRTMGNLSRASLSPLSYTHHIANAHAASCNHEATFTQFKPLLTPLLGVLHPMHLVLAGRLQHKV